MSLTSTKKIVLDFYNKNIVTVNAKQKDSKSRYLNIVCSDNSRKVYLDKMYAAAYIRYTKNDGNKIFNRVDILNDGTILVEFTEQMLAVVGKHEIEIVITSISDKTISDPSEDLAIFYENGCTIISTMTFYLNVMPIMADVSEIVSTDEYTSLSRGLTSLTYLTQVEGAVITANEKAVFATEAAELANKEAASANDAAEYAIEKADALNAISERAEKAAINCENMLSKPVVYSKEKGMIGGVAPLNNVGTIAADYIDENSLNNIRVNNLTTQSAGSYVLDAYQGYVLNDKIESLFQNHVHYSNTVNNSIGSDGDILLVPVS